MKKVIATLALLLASATTASAGWTGCRIGVIGGVAAANTGLDVALTGIPISGGVDGFGSDGFAGGGLVGCDYQMDRIVVGAFADYQLQDLKWSAGLALGPNSGKLETSLGDQWSVGVRAGITLTPTTLLYGQVGYTEAKSDPITLSINGTAVGSVGVEDAQGWFVGGGIESEFLMPNLFLALDYRFTRFDSRAIDLGGLPATANLDTDVHAIKAILTYKFGPTEIVKPLK